MGIRSNPLMKKVFEAGEAQVDRLVGQILSNDRFVAAVQTVVSRSLAAKGNLDKSIRSGLATMNLPSTKDIEDLSRRLDELDRSLAELGGKVSQIEKTLSAPKTPSNAKTAPSSPTAKVAKPKDAVAASGKGTNSSKRKAAPKSPGKKKSQQEE